MLRVCAVSALLLILFFPVASAAPPVTPPVVEYTIDVKLDPAAKTLKGKQQLTWRNPSDDAVSELQFHLYLNAFRDRNSTFMRESGGGRLRGDRFSDTSRVFGSINVDRMQVRGGELLTSRIRFIHPDGNNREDRTVISVSLPRPVPPRGTIVLDIDFSAKLPSIFARSGFVRDFFMVGQWFPKLGVYEPAGMRHRVKGGWNCHAYHANSEYYADFGTYDVTMRVPSDFVVGATGRLMSKSTAGGVTAHRYRETNVHDFAWTADRRYVVREERFDPQRDVPKAWVSRASRLLGKSPAELRLRPFTVRYLMQPDHVGQFERYREAVNAAIAWCGLFYGPYPYVTLTVVDPPEDARGAAGMEYPGLFTAGTHRTAQWWPFRRLRYPEVVAVHEFAHQYWYGMVGSNEFEESWLDEGLTTFTEQEVMDAYYGEQYAMPFGMGLSSIAINRSRYRVHDRRDPIVRESWKYSSDLSYARNSYAIPSVALTQLRSELGEAAFARCLRAYFEQWSFRHPDTRDFFQTFSRVSGRDLSVWERNIFRGIERLDFLVRRAESVRRGAGWRSKTVIDRNGDVVAGAAVEFRFADGSVKYAMVRPNARTTVIEVSSSSPLVSVTVDPAVKNVWDTDLLNNSWRLQPDVRSKAKMSLRLGGIALRFFELFRGAA